MRDRRTIKTCWALIAVWVLMLAGCAPAEIPPPDPEEVEAPPLRGVVVDETSYVLGGRFGTPPGFQRLEAEEGTFAAYLRTLPLKPHGAAVHTFDGKKKWNTAAYEAVVDMDIGDKDLQQCADAVMRLRAEHLFSEGAYGEIVFNLTNGFPVPYEKWREGWRIRVSGNETAWERRAEADSSYEGFRRYLEFIFMYAGTLSLDRDLKPVSFGEMQIGDVLVQGGSPGHAVIVVDMAEDPKTGRRLFMLAQSYMPAQDIHVLANPADSRLSPWYALEGAGELRTPEWTFQREDLKRF